ncbi:DUF5067 domain-containing protein [Schumannella soli]|uniref:DUF5067 domain-containing protein n=2 Tax=Schumannella soli TaxID=2590779 RepID=A0A506YAT6_9MICO|nr:DUF5067 domain-containing protein [Schumannella soli]
MIVVYTAAFAAAVSAVKEDSVPKAGTTAAAAGDDSDAADGSSITGASFKDGVLTTSTVKIEIVSHSIIQPGQAGNEYGSKPVIAIVYKTTNLTSASTSPSIAWLSNFEAFQDNDPNSVNSLDLGMTPGDQYTDTQLQDIKEGGTVENAIAYELDDLTTPVKLSAKDGLLGGEVGSVTYKLQ